MSATLAAHFDGYHTMGCAYPGIASFIHERKPPWSHLVLNVFNAPSEVIEVVGTTTEMKMTKHDYQVGINAEQGIEF